MDSFLLFFPIVLSAFLLIFLSVFFRFLIFSFVFFAYSFHILSFDLNFPKSLGNPFFLLYNKTRENLILN